MPTATDIVSYLTALGTVAEDDVQGVDLEGARAVEGVQSDRLAGTSDLAWLSAREWGRDPGRVARFAGAVLIAPMESIDVPHAGGVVVRASRPKLAFSQAVAHFFPGLTAIEWPAAGARTHAGSRVHPDAELAPGAVIGSGVEIGADAVIGPNSCLANCTIAAGVRIGANCTIGLAGFGYERDENGRYWRFPHVGRVVIAEEVEIGNNTCIDRGALGNTVIGRGVKIDNLVHIAHNVTLGEHVMVIAHAMVAGSVSVGDGAWIAPSAAVKNQLTIGSEAVVGVGAVVTRNVESGAVVVGNPAKPIERRAE